MKKLLNDITKKLRSNGDESLKMYYEMFKHPGWETHRTIIAEIRMGIISELLSERFTKLPPDEKDSQQKAFHITDQVLQYLLHPMAVEQKREDFKAKHSKSMGINPVTGRDLNEKEK